MKLKSKRLLRSLLFSVALCFSSLPTLGQSQTAAQTQEQKPKPKELPDAPSKGEPLAKPLPAAKPQSPDSGPLELLTPTQGVDFTNYLNRVLASARRSWFAILPETVRRGDKGRVVLQFRIMRDGSVPAGGLKLVVSSGKEPLDRAAMSAIRASSPFEKLPPAFSGPYIELRFNFLYNLPPEAPK